MPDKSAPIRTGLFVLVAALSSLAVGLVIGIKVDAAAHYYDRLSYHVRDSLGLAKSWVKLPGPTQALGRTERPCPAAKDAVVLVIGGQSNASNAVPVRYEVKRDVAVWFDDRCFAASDPMLGATSDGGSIWSLLGDEIADDLDRPVLLIVGAVGGTQFGDWLDPRSGYYADLIRRVSSARQVGYHPDIILWHQGETDAEAERNLVAFKEDVNALIKRLLADIPEAPLYLFQATRCIGDYRVDGVPEVVAAMQRVADANPRVIKGMNTDSLGRNYRWDTCHFNSLARDEIVRQITPELVTRLRSAD